jgi:hypothetical protein
MQVCALLLWSLPAYKCPAAPGSVVSTALAYLTLFPTLQRRAQVPSKSAQLAPALLCVIARRPFSVNGNTTQPLTAQHFDGQTCSIGVTVAQAHVRAPPTCMHAHTPRTTPFTLAAGAKCTPSQHPTHLAKAGCLTTMLNYAGEHCALAQRCPSTNSWPPGAASSSNDSTALAYSTLPPRCRDALECTECQHKALA